VRINSIGEGQDTGQYFLFIPKLPKIQHIRSL